MAEFFDLLNLCFAILQLEKTVLAARLKESQKKLILCSSLFHRYVDCFDRFLADRNAPCEITAGAREQDPLFKIGWSFVTLIKERDPCFLVDFEYTFQLFAALLVSICEKLLPATLKSECNGSKKNERVGRRLYVKINFFFF